VNGQWINGRFAKRSTVAVKRKAAPRATPVRNATARNAPNTAAARTPAASQPPAALPAPVPHAPPARAERTEAPAPAAASTAAAAPLADDVRMRQLQEALQARTQSLLVTSAAASPAPAPPSLPGPQLQEALKARSQTILVTNIPDPQPAVLDLSGPSETASLGPVRVPSPRAEMRSVTFDFGSGLKTTVFGDGTIAKEAFDVRAVRELASRGSPAAD